ncbi:carbonate dehydratase [Telluribacter sp.]|jgi:carbonic anhydrase|uniref:carbonate dehydratase n=1 Tax=Telluribacter sp. TaxID=1978767 RepID=UPI002E158CBC|nr:carbonate dehydratase [Telluribacter sp.]
MALAYANLFEQNKKWVEEMNRQNPEFFATLAKGQSPQFLWIGCSDSRVPANEITGTLPGDIFVHRNIANMVVHTDMNMLSVLDYSVNVLGVRHIIVCGHYGCGGVAAALGNKQVGLIDNWLRHIKDVYRLHKEELDTIGDTKEKTNRLVELNVHEQVYDLSKTSIVQNAWARGQFLQLHGLVYDIANGYLKDLSVTVGDNNELDNVYKFDTGVLE